MKGIVFHDIGGIRLNNVPAPKLSESTNAIVRTTGLSKRLGPRGRARNRASLIAFAAVVGLASTALAPVARACPKCAEGRQARSEVWRDHFGENLASALLPFLIIGAVCLRADTIGPKESCAERGAEPILKPAPEEEP